MIFVTVGTHYVGFERLVKKMDELALKIDEKVIIQKGSTSYTPKKANYFDYEKEEVINQLYHDSRIIVSHAGAGSLIMAINLGKPIIIVPRQQKFKEHIDDQQFELADALKKERNILSIHDINEIDSIITNKFQVVVPVKNNRLCGFIKKHISSK